MGLHPYEQLPWAAADAMIRWRKLAAQPGMPLGSGMAQANQEIVLVEDDESVRQAIERILRGVGYGVRAFASAEELLGSLEKPEQFSDCRCLICDIGLPGLSGFELLRRWQERGLASPWIFITAHDDPALRRQADHEGAAYLLKPFRGRALLAVVAQSIRAA